MLWAPISDVASVVRLQVAVVQNDVRAIDRWLTEPHPNIDTKGASLNTPLWFAFSDRVSFEVFDRLVRAGANDPAPKTWAALLCKSMPFYAPAKAHFGPERPRDQLKKLKYVVNLKASDLQYRPTRERRTPFDLAASTDQPLLLDYLHSLGVVDPEAIGYGSAHLRILRRLLDCGPSLSNSEDLSDIANYAYDSNRPTPSKSDFLGIPICQVKTRKGPNRGGKRFPRRRLSIRASRRHAAATRMC